MRSIIHVLDDITINQIAAGEVIENPASVVKELIENSIDADASFILVEVSGSGRHQIRVTDNGIGMSFDDALLCFERHATSKVNKIEDLDQLFSMGFRGEALPSIASISFLRLMTKQRDESLGTLVEIQGGKQTSAVAVPCDNGTMIEVSDLFYNVPARRKFLNSPKSDLSEIQKIVTDIAFGNPHIHFILKSDGEVLLDVPLAPGCQERAGQLIHEGIFDNMIPFVFQEEGLFMEGLIGDPSLHRPNRKGQSLFLNKRAIVSHEISYAVLEGYGTALPENRYPVFHIHLELPPHTFDINVHPQKKQVRFSHLFHLKELIRKGVFEALNRECKKAFSFSDVLQPPVAAAYEMPAAPLVFAKKNMVSEYFDRETNVPIPSLPVVLKTPAILAIFPCYIFLENENGLSIVDIQKARKRILYERILTKKGKKEKQLLLVPVVLPFDKELKMRLSEFEEMGFSFDQEGACIAIPPFLKEDEIESVLQDLLEGKDLDRHLAEKAIRHLVRDHKILLQKEAEHLIQELFACQQPVFGPLGERIIAKVAWEDFGRFFL